MSELQAVSPQRHSVLSPWREEGAVSVPVTQGNQYSGMSLYYRSPGLPQPVPGCPKQSCIHEIEGISTVAKARARIGVTLSHSTTYNLDTGNMGILGTSQDSPWHSWTHHLYIGYTLAILG